MQVMGASFFLNFKAKFNASYVQLNNNDILKAIAKFAVSHKSDIIIVFFYNELKPLLRMKKNCFVDRKTFIQERKHRNIQNVIRNFQIVIIRLGIFRL